ncbi:protein-tyrosine phosphatase, partial [Corynespora cassiicola Philippines]
PARLCPVLPPANFGAVVPRSVYRSSYPQPENFGFMKSLGLKTILTLVPGEISTQYSHFMTENDIQHFQVPLPANKGSIKVDACQMSKALGIILDRANHPVLIHCNKGKHRTGCVVGCLRKVQGEDMETIYSEYHIYAGEKARILDEGYMELFDVNTVLWMARRFNWISPDAEVAPLTQVPSLSPTRSSA